MSAPSLCRERVTVSAPSVIALARRIWGRPGSVLLWSADGAGPSYLACDPIDSTSMLDPEPSLQWGASSIARDEETAALTAPRWIGLLPYEAERGRLERQAFVSAEHRNEPLVATRVWYRYPAVAIIEPLSAATATIVGDNARAVKRLERLLLNTVAQPAPEARLQARAQGRAVADARAHQGRVRRALELIRHGDVYQINLARRIDFGLQGDSLALLAHMSRKVQAPYALAWELSEHCGVAGTSPELFLKTSPARDILTMPIKGTRPVESARAAEMALELERDPKERAELSMIVDVERNDLGRVCRFGSVIAEVPHVIRYSTVLHRVARVRGLARKDISRTDLLHAMLPSGSVTGAPKIRAMELIAAMEDTRRGLYTGAIGYLSHNGCLNLAMAIRTLVRRGSEGHYHVGGGIVADSDPHRELEETYWKSEQVRS